MIGIMAVCGLLLIAWTACRPSMPGMRWSMKIASGRSCLQIFDGLLGRFGHVDFNVVFLEHAAQDDARRLGIVDD